MSPQDYDDCYIILGLSPGAGLNDIVAASQEMTSLLAPSQFSQGPLRACAEKKCKSISAAREILSDYWNQNNGVPPSAQEQPGGSQIGDRKKRDKNKPAFLRRTDAQLREKRTVLLALKQAQDSRPALLEAAPDVSTKRTIGPSPIRKLGHHHVYDIIANLGPVCESIISTGTAILIIFVCFALANTLSDILSTLPILKDAEHEAGMYAFITDPKMQYLMDCAYNFLFSLFLSVPILNIMKSERILFEIQNKPYIQLCSLPAQTVAEKISKILGSPFYSFDEQAWSLLASECDTKSNTYSSTFAGKLAYPVQLKTHVKAVSLNSSLLTYWFEFKSVPGWQTSVANLLETTDRALWHEFSAYNFEALPHLMTSRLLESKSSDEN